MVTIKEYLQILIVSFLEKNNNIPFYLRFPYTDMLDKKTIIKNGQCFHKELWETVGGYKEDCHTDVQFITDVHEAGYKIYDTDYDREIAYPIDYYFLRDHPHQYSKIGAI